MIKRELEDVARYPPLDEWLAATQTDEPTGVTPAEIVQLIREDRDSH